MAICKYCQARMDWGRTKQGKWVPLEPLNSEFNSELDKTFQDENGELRATHAIRCVGRGPAILIAPLAFPVPGHKPF